MNRFKIEVIFRQHTTFTRHNVQSGSEISGIIELITDPFHQLVYGLTGKEHVSELTQAEARAVQAELQERMRLKNHDKPLKKEKTAKDDVPGMITSAQQRLAWRLVYRLDELEPTAASVPERLIGAIEKICGITASDADPFLWVDFNNGTKLIEQLKRYVRSAERRAAKKAGDG